MMEGSIHLVTSGLLTADTITNFSTPGHRLGVGGDIASKKTMGRYEARVVLGVTRLQVVRRLIHGETGDEDVIEVFHPAMPGKKCRPAPSSKGAVANKRFHPEDVPGGTSGVDRNSTCAPGDMRISLCAIGEPFSTCAYTPVEFAWMNAVGSEADSPS